MNTTSLVGFVPLVVSLPNVTSLPGSATNGLFIDHLENVLGTSFDLKIAARSLSVARQAEQLILNEIDRLDAILSSYRSDSEFSQWLTEPLNEAVAISDDLFAVLSSFDHWRKKTDGVINAAAEVMCQLWEQAAQTKTVPTDVERLRAVADAGQVHWQLDPTNQTATRLSNIPLRLNSFSKSYVLDRAAEVALTIPDVDGLVLNSGGDIVVRGNWQELVAVANPRSDAENAAPMTRIQVKNGTVATSGDYRRGWQLENKWVSHIMDTRTGLPAHTVISATVMHPDAVTAGALATAFTILTPAESALLAAELPGTEYLLITPKGQSITSTGWSGVALPGSTSGSATTPVTTAHLLSLPAKDKLWNANQELLITLELARIEGRSHRPFVAVWIEDEAGKPIRQLALWYNKPRWLHELHEWSNLQTDNAASVTSATRSPGEYTLLWDGKDDGGQWVKQGKYTVLIEAAREHGTYQLIRQVMDFNGKTKQQTLNGNVEVAAAALDYREKSATH